jgi:hypothetical protein
MPVEQGKVEYHETLRSGVLFHVLALGLVIAFLAACIVTLVQGKAGLAFLCGILCVLLIVAYTLFAKLSFTISDVEISFGFTGVKKRFPRSALLSCEPCRLTFANYMGIGMRIGLDGTMAYNTRMGPGVKMVFEGARRPYVVSVDDPEKICGILAMPGTMD